MKRKASLGTRPSKQAEKRKVFSPRGETRRTLAWRKEPSLRVNISEKLSSEPLTLVGGVGTMGRTRPRKPLMEAGGGRRDPETQKRQPAAAFTVAQKNTPRVTQH